MMGLRGSAPAFWTRPPGILSALLTPVAWCVGRVAVKRLGKTGWKVPVPVICCGNLTVGGTGKTTVVLDLVQRLQRRGQNVHVLTRGFGGALRGPLQVDIKRHGIADVGDEARLLASVAPCWIGADRGASAQAAIGAGATCLVMDDGLQNPSLEKSFSFIIVDGYNGFGNMKVIPAGPLRVPVREGLAEGNAMIMIGHDSHNISKIAGDIPVLQAHLENGTAIQALEGKRVVAFAGIGRPGKFFQTLREAGVDPVHCVSFPDHHPYSLKDCQHLCDMAMKSGAVLATTPKDAVRWPTQAQMVVHGIPVALRWDDDAAMEALLDRILSVGQQESRANV
ncbi:MAG: tetraacyldisaccharide 4'-kinase [Acetobacter sp.]|jgi:tetraacyldisaccharide 4'-kinase